jgi:hypothetical protein
MAFWSQANVEPKRGFRFIVQIGQQTVWWAKQVTTPSFDVGEVEHSFLGNKYYFPGKVSWSSVNMTLVDPISPDAVALTNQYLVDSGYMIPINADSPDQWKTISKNKATNVGLENIDIQVVNADGTIIEHWRLENPFVKSVKFGDLSYEDDALRTVELEIRFDWATCEFPEAPVDDQYFVAGESAGSTSTPAPSYDGSETN